MRTRNLSRVTLLCALGISLSAFAHDPGLSSATARLKPNALEITFAFAVRDANQISQLDTDHDGVIASAEFDAGKAALEKIVADEFDVQCDGKLTKPVAMRSWLDTKNDACVVLSLPATKISNLVFQARFLSRLPTGHRQFLTMFAEDGRSLGERLLSESADSVTLQIASFDSRNEEHRASDRSFAGFFVLGVEHILTGYDHLLFLFALMVVTSRFAPALKIITCFTLAHSIALGIATLSPITIPSRIVEPLIAASIVYVAIENLIRGDDPKGRWRLTFGFGLIHGLGFAAVLRELGVGANGSRVALPLLSFNLGVESGQIMIAAVVLPLIWRLRTHPTFTRRWVPVCSLLVGMLGGYWFVTRVL
jgi:hydrogenase/urease accessory protein HupE